MKKLLYIGMMFAGVWTPWLQASNFSYVDKIKKVGSTAAAFGLGASYPLAIPAATTQVPTAGVAYLLAPEATKKAAKGFHNFVLNHRVSVLSGAATTTAVLVGGIMWMFWEIANSGRRITFREFIFGLDSVKKRDSSQ